jgi:acetyl esterase/lipase
MEGTHMSDASRISFPLWTEAERADTKRFGTFRSCIPQLLWYPADTAVGPPRGAVIVCPGGGYFFRAPYEGEPIALLLNAHGIHAFVLEYRFAPDSHPAPLSDARRAIRTARGLATRLGFRPDRVGILGFSAGGHVAGTSALCRGPVPGMFEAVSGAEAEAARPDAAVLCYPVLTMREMTHAGSRLNLLGPDPDQDLVDALSCELHVDADAPPIFLWHTADDPVVPVANPLLAAGALSTAGKSFELHVFPHGDHGVPIFESTPPVSGWTDLCTAWLTRLGF